MEQVSYSIDDEAIKAEPTSIREKNKKLANKQEKGDQGYLRNYNPKEEVYSMHRKNPITSKN